MDDFDFSIDDAQKRVVVIDLEGVILDFKHRSHHISGDKKDWKAFERACVEDTAYPEAKLMVDRLRKNYFCHIISGRSNEYLPDTVRQLKEAGIGYDALTMKPSNVFKKTADLMREFVEGIGVDRVEFILTNRFQTQQMFIDMGLPVIQLQHKRKDELF